MCETCGNVNHVKALPNLGEIVARVARLFNRPKPILATVDKEAANRATRIVLAQFNTDVSNAIDELIATQDVQAYSLRFRELLRRLYVQEAIISVGGVKNLSSTIKDVVEERLKEQRPYIDRWMQQLGTTENLNKEVLALRANMYAESSLSMTYELDSMMLGLPKLPFYPKDGTTECLMNCYCKWEVKKVPNGFDCIWRIDDTRENCPVCIRRASKITVASPLQVRNGKIIDANKYRQYVK